MRVGILYGDIQGSTTCKELASSLSEGISGQGHMVDLIDMRLEAGKIISFYEYIVIGCSPVSFWGGKIPGFVSTFLKQSGSLSGKRCFAFIPKKGIRQGRTLQILMHEMEGQGMYLKYSDILQNKGYAKEVGKRLAIS